MLNIHRVSWPCILLLKTTRAIKLTIVQIKLIINCLTNNQTNILFAFFPLNRVTEGLPSYTFPNPITSDITGIDLYLHGILSKCLNDFFSEIFSRAVIHVSSIYTLEDMCKAFPKTVETD